MLFTEHDTTPTKGINLKKITTDKNTCQLFKEINTDILTLNNLSTQLHQESDSIDSQALSSSYSLFNKNFTTFMKYTDTNIDINMALSSNCSAGSPSSDETHKNINEMLANTSLDSLNAYNSPHGSTSNFFKTSFG